MGSEEMQQELTVGSVADALAENLVSVRHWSDSSFLRLPIIYPSGGFVTVQLSATKTGFRVSDSGLAYREAEFLGIERSFVRMANKIAQNFGLSVGKEILFCDTPYSFIERAVNDVGTASYMIAESIVSRFSEVESATVSDRLKQRLGRIFNSDVKYDLSVDGEVKTWPVTAVAHRIDVKIIYQAVENNSNSVYRTSTAFHDLAKSEEKSKLVSVVSNPREMGDNLGLLSNVGMVIGVDETDEAYLRTAA